ncbi:hypothetical protein GS597_01430 [Synechococcales cyanobacterium C]|uniref:Major capsid protein n=1 Tax=Petrachloros mirabilis ULC683 TaxID=2781853 RepID=A0A8K1ZW64_9CYAN|nr:hypothetical protein [Petrachloros mirabilis]NCJ05201.1 hypothetical protein [Petrachloros mirabilis ULC683]
MSTSPQSPQQVRVQDPILTDFAHGYKHNERVGNLLFPPVPVAVSGGQVLQFGKESFRKYHLRRAPGGKKKRITFGYLGKPFSLYQDAMECPIPYEHMRDATVMPGIDLGQQATTFGMDVISLQVELDQAGIATNAANYNSNNTVALTGGDKFSSSTCDVPAKVDEYKEAVRSQIGAYPNVGIFGPSAFVAAKNNPFVVDRFKYTSPESITEAMLAQLLGLQRVAVGKSIYFDDDDESEDVWGNNLILAYVPPLAIQGSVTYAPNGRISMMMPSFGYTYAMDGHPLVEQPYNDRSCDSWIYPVKHERAPVLTGLEDDGLSTSGFLVQGVA